MGSVYSHRRKNTTRPVQVALSALMPAPENMHLYRPIADDDAEILALAESIREHGVLEALVVAADGFIISGHRRYAAARRAGLGKVPVRRLPIRRADDPDGFLRLLREHNRQREKTNVERLREEVVDADPAEAHAELHHYRREKAAISVSPMKTDHGPFRAAISEAKRPMLRAVQAVIEARRPYWPLSDRQIHYALLSTPPLIHGSKPESVYQNDQRSYRRLVDLLTRARLDNEIPFEAIGDETRPVEVWDTHETVRSFLRRELDGMFRGYWRDLLQSQPHHIELLGEKLTVAPILRPVAAEYTIPLTIGRGYCSLPPRHAMAERFEASGKDKLILLVVSDFDPEGEDIGRSFAASLRDDFDIGDVHAIKIALTADQVAEHNLPPIMKAKAASSRAAKFVARHGHDVFELESLAPDALQTIVRSAIEAVVDRDALSAEIAAERQDAVFLAGVRRVVGQALEGIDLDDE